MSMPASRWRLPIVLCGPRKPLEPRRGLRTVGPVNYPLKLRFKFFALAPQIYVEDATGAEVCYVKQRLFRFREKVEVYTDSSRTNLLSTIEADRIIDFNSCYTFKMADGTSLGSVRRRGLRSLWSAHYEILDDSGNVVFEIRELNPMVKFVDGLIGDIPLVGLFSGYFLHPRYAILQNGSPVLHMTKERSFLESRFVLEKSGESPARGRDAHRPVPPHVRTFGANPRMIHRCSFVATPE